MYSSYCLATITTKHRFIKLSSTFQGVFLIAIVQGYCRTPHYNALNHRPSMSIHTSPMPSESITIKRSHLNHPISIEERNNHPKKVVKDIQSCGADVEKALDILTRAYPHLIHGASSLSSLTMSSSSDILIIDGRSISITMDVLKKEQNWDVSYALLDNTVQSFHWNKRNSKYNPSQEKSDECSIRTVYKSFFSLASHFNRIDWILYLLTTHLPLYAGLSPTIDMMHATLSAFGRCDRLELVLDWLIKMENEEIIFAGNYIELPKELLDKPQSSYLCTSPQTMIKIPAPDRLAYQTASTAFGHARRGNEAAMIFKKMHCRGFTPTLQAYNQILFAFSRAGGEPDRHIEAIKFLLEMEKNHVMPNDISYETVISICMRENAWEAAAEIIRRCEGSSASDKYSNLSANIEADESKMKKYISGMDQYQKIGTGRYGWYKLGIYQDPDKDLSISFGFQMHRNPGFNGLSFVFFNQEDMEKLGFILVRHSSLRNEESSNPLLFSDLMGMYVDDKFRGKGLANIFMSLWLKIAIIAEFLPRTEVINKPLLSLVLTRFGFVPRNGNGGFEVVVSPLQRPSEVDDTTSPLFSLYSPTCKHLQSVFGVRERRIQRMKISRTPEHGAKTTFVKTYFDHPWTVYNMNRSLLVSDEITRKKLEEAQELLIQKIGLALPGRVDLLVNSTQLRFALFGFLSDT